MGPKAYGVVTGILFSLGALAHLTRLNNWLAPHAWKHDVAGLD